jgi:hypothetical protein
MILKNSNSDQSRPGMAKTRCSRAYYDLGGGGSAPAEFDTMGWNMFVGCRVAHERPGTRGSTTACPVLAEDSSSIYYTSPRVPFSSANFRRGVCRRGLVAGQPSRPSASNRGPPPVVAYDTEGLKSAGIDIKHWDRSARDGFCLVLALRWRRGKKDDDQQWQFSSNFQARRCMVSEPLSWARASTRGETTEGGRVPTAVPCPGEASGAAT